ncbi:hypothetical protein EDD37DRAFT_382323 [Exophiala viscosa]|uniref:uncharacterized protein n=1 Tax=Exophiala viscosa TaxID=2486360 RepID=UPI0021930CA9|nr:hypothetical protein EDD37DRAFT_382323 [Exophiala viscosa]
MDPTVARQRASAACATCRKRRTKCTREPGDDVCTQCKDRGVSCITYLDDLRKRKKSAAYIDSLQSRIGSLEAFLAQSSGSSSPRPRLSDSFGFTTQPPPIVHLLSESPPNLQTDIDAFTEGATSFLNQAKTYLTASDSIQDQGLQSQSDTQRGQLLARATRANVNSPLDKLQSAKGTENLIPRLVSGESLDQTGTRPSRLIDSALLVPGTSGSQTRQTELSWTRLFIDQLSSSCKQYLLNCFSTRFNSIFNVVNMDVFLESMARSRKPYYSLFLHITILAVGLLYAEPDNPEVQKLQSRERGAQKSALHRQCWLLVESELAEQPTLALGQGLLLLAEIEMRQGDGNMGCLLIGTACRLCLAICPDNGACETHFGTVSAGCERGVLDTCVVYDTYRSQILRRPTVLHRRNTEGARGNPNNVQLFTASARIEQVIHTILMDLVEPVHGFLDKYSASLGCAIDAGTFFEMTSVHQNLAHRYSSWPETLALDFENQSEGNQSLLFLHLYYHNAVLCLHQSWGFRSGMIVGDSEEGSEAYQAARNSSQAICLDHARMISRLLGKWRGRANGTQIPTLALGYASNAMTYITAALEESETLDSRAEVLESLRLLEKVLPATPSRSQGPSIASLSSNDHYAGWTPINATQQQVRMSTSPQRPNKTFGRGAVSSLAPATLRGVIALPEYNNSQMMATSSREPISPETHERRIAAQVRITQDGSTESDGASLYDQGDSNNDRIFLPKERQLLGLSPSGQ